MNVRTYMQPRRSAFVAARPSGFVNPLDPFGLLTGGPFGPSIGAPSLTAPQATNGWGSAPGDGYGAGSGPSTATRPPTATQPTVDTRLPTSQQPAMPAPRGTAPTPTPTPAPAPIAAPADTGLSASTVILGVLAVGGIAGAAYYFTKKGRR